MNSELILQVIGIGYGADGVKAEVIYNDPESGLNKWAAINSLLEPKRSGGTELLLENQRRVKLPVDEIAYCLPDRTGVMVIFPCENPSVFEGLPDFLPPHNAAIFNSNGSLRFRLTVEQGRYIHSPFNRTVHYKLGSFGQSEGNPNEPVWQFGALVGDIGFPPEWFYEFDGENPELKNTGQWVRF